MKRRHVYPAVGLVVATMLVGCGDSPPRVPIEPTQAAVSVSTPEQPFLLSGDVYDIAGRPLGGARAQVNDGPRAGTDTTTDEAGRFTMPGTFTGTIRVTASKDGYVPTTKSFNQATSHVFSLEPIEPSRNIAGTYTLTLTADSACTNMPDEVRTRTYAAAIAPGARTGAFVATLSDPRFLVKCEAVSQPPGTCAHDRISIGIVGDYAGMYLGIIEQLAQAAYLLFDAGAQGTFGAAGITAPLNGSIEYCSREPFLIDQGTWACPAGAGVRCDSQRHQLTLVRR